MCVNEYEVAAQAFHAALDEYNVAVSDHRAAAAAETLIVTVLRTGEVVYSTAAESLHGCWHDSEIGARAFGKPVQWNLRDGDGRFVDSGFAADEDEARSRMAYRARSRRADAAIANAYSKMSKAFALMMAIDARKRWRIAITHAKTLNRLFFVRRGKSSSC